MAQVSNEVPTLYGPIAKTLWDKLGQIRLLACDIDGVFSDGRLYMGNNGEELKAFHTHDGYGVKALLNIGIEVAVITGRKSNIVQQRMQSLGVTHIIQGCEQKDVALLQLMQELQLNATQVASMGDDVPDLAMFKHSELGVSVADGHPQVTQVAQYVTQRPGGKGAVREFCDLLLQANNQLQQVHGSST